jgi:hypothetical protein
MHLNTVAYLQAPCMCCLCCCARAYACEKVTLCTSGDV